MSVRAEIKIFGRVQGVFFRGSTQEEARRLGLVGEVANLPDGRVEVTVEGTREAVEELVAWCRRGPPDAQVEKVDVQWSTARGGYRSFTVSR